MWPVSYWSHSCLQGPCGQVPWRPFVLLLAHTDARRGLHSSIPRELCISGVSQIYGDFLSRGVPERGGEKENRKLSCQGTLSLSCSSKAGSVVSR